MSDNAIAIEKKAESWVIGEAPASWNTKYLTPQGFECQLTLRDVSGIELLKKANAALLALANSGCVPVFYNSARGDNHKPSEEPEQPDMKVCEIHNAEMKKHEKDGEVWYSHKLADGKYCKGKK